MPPMATPVTILSYPRCGTCRKALAWLEAHGVEHTVRPIAEDKPSEEELTSWLEVSGLPVRRLFNTSGKLYRELNMKDRFKEGISEDECLELLARDGMLVKRPIVVGDGFVLVGFKEAEWEDRLLS